MSEVSGETTGERHVRGAPGMAGMHRPCGGYGPLMTDHGQHDHGQHDDGQHHEMPAAKSAGHGRPRRRRVAAGAAALSLLVAGCGGDDDTGARVEEEVSEVGGAVADAIEEFGRDSVELAARNLASLRGADEFSDAGHQIEGDLACEADATDDLTAVEIECSGATADGSRATLTGTTTELPGASLTELEGTFTGFVDDVEVFGTEALG